jgi:hypothetical protein
LEKDKKVINKIFYFIRMPPFNLNKFRENVRATLRAWHPPPPGLSLPQPPPQIIEENANAGNSILAAINLERQTGLPAAAAPFVPAPAAALALNPNAQAFVPAAAAGLNPNAQAFVPAAAAGLNPNAEAFVPAAAAGLNPNAEAFVPAVNPNAGGKRRRYRKSRKTRKARKTRKTKKSRRTYK